LFAACQWTKFSGLGSAGADLPIQLRLIQPERDNDVQNGIHFISGLPRAGSTLLAALLRQNPRFHADMTSPVGSLFSALLRQMSQENETAVFIDDDQRARLLRACFDAFYADLHPEKLVFDTNRRTTKLPALVELFPDLRMICCVRNPAWIIDSIERLTRQNKFEPSKILIFAICQPVARNPHWRRLVSRSRRDRAFGSCAS
jgi:Sulfotransferase family